MAEKLQDDARRLVKTYLILVSKATNRQTIRYGVLADQIGVARQGVGQSCLNPVYRFCMDNDYPDLTVLAVQRDTGEPAEGHFDRATLYREREKVYDFPWTDYAPPTVDGQATDP